MTCGPCRCGRHVDLKLRAADELPPVRRRMLWALIDAGREVSTHDLVQFCGPTASKANVKVHITMIRRWLRDAGLPHAIQHVPREGYRLI